MFFKSLLEYKLLSFIKKENDNYLEGNDFYQGLCRKFTSKEGTDVTVWDRIEIYLTLNNLCEKIIINYYNYAKSKKVKSFSMV